MYLDRLRCISDGIGVILDWVPAHFPDDEHGLGYFDGTHLLRARRSAAGLPSRLEIGHLQLRPPRSAQLPAIERRLLARQVPHRRPARRRRRVDAVSRLLPQSRANGFRTSTAAARTSRRSRSCGSSTRPVIASYPDMQTIAEESTAWPMVSRPVYIGGLGFGIKWDMGWMHDTLAYFAHDPVHRRYHHNELTFRGLYAFTRELRAAAVARRGRARQGLAARQDARRRLAALRQPAPAVRVHVRAAGQEAAVHGRRVRAVARVEPRRQPRLAPAGDERGARAHAAVRRRAQPPLSPASAALHALDGDARGIEWVEANDAEYSVLAFMRSARRRRRNRCSWCATSRRCRATTIASASTRPAGGSWREIYNSDAGVFGGSGHGNGGRVAVTPIPWHGRKASLNLTLPPLGALYLKVE